MGRRIRKRVETFNGSSWPETGDELFVYDGWNVVMILNANEQNEVMREYTWGLDLSATVHGAGGIGGLLADYHPTGGNRYWYFYDANGNVGQVLNATSTNNITLAAHYEYDPYGNIIGPDDNGPSNPGHGDWRDGAGAFALANPIRFSTKWFDAQTGLGYWGYRYYSPRLGRWISRDPIGEGGGLNLYMMVKNSTTNRIDPVGLYTPEQCVAMYLTGQFGTGPEAMEQYQLCLMLAGPYPPSPPGPPRPPPPAPNEVCGIYVWLYTGQRCTERYRYNAALDAAAGTEKCWFDCMIRVNKCAAGVVVPAATSVLIFTHEEIGKTSWELSQGFFGQSEVTTLQSRLSYCLLGMPGLNWLADLLRQNGALVSSCPVKTAAGSVIAGAALVEAGIGVYCGYSCSGQ